MNVLDLYTEHFGNKSLTISDGEPSEILKDGSLRPVLNAPRVTIGRIIGEEPDASHSNVVTYQYELSPIEDPFWLELFLYFQQSGFYIHIDEQGTLRITTFGGLYITTLSVAKDCVSLANSTYRYFRDHAKDIAKRQDQERCLDTFRESTDSSKDDEPQSETA